MLAVVDSRRATWDPGVVALALLSCFEADGPGVLFIDANPAGTALANRFGEAMGTQFSPAARGLPTLMAAGADGLDAASVKDHCYRVEMPGRSDPWLLFAPTSRRGAAESTAWLNEHAAEIAALGSDLRLVIASSLKGVGAPAPANLLSRADTLVVVAPANTAADKEALADPFADTDIGEFPDQHRMHLLEGAKKPTDVGVLEPSAPQLLGRLPAGGDEDLLAPNRKRRRELDRLAAAVQSPESVGESGRGRRAAPVQPRAQGVGRGKGGRSRPQEKSDPKRPAPVKPSRRRAAAPQAKSADGARGRFKRSKSGDTPAGERPPPVTPGRRNRRTKGTDEAPTPPPPT